MRNIDIKLQASRQLIAFICLLTISTLGIMFYLPIFWFIKILLWVGINTYGSILLCRHGLLGSKDSLLGLKRVGEEWIVQTRSKTFPAELCGDSMVTTFLCILRFRCFTTRHKVSYVICNDSLEDYRDFLMRIHAG